MQYGRSAVYGFCHGSTYEEAIRKRNDAELITKNSIIDTPKTFGDVYGMTSGTFGGDNARIVEKFIISQIGAMPVTSDSTLAAVIQEVKRKPAADEDSKRRRI